MGGRFVLGVLHTTLPGRLDNLRAPGAAGIVRQLRWRVTFVIFCSLLTVPVAIWLLGRGLETYYTFFLAGHPFSSCEFLRLWLQGFLVMQIVQTVLLLTVAISSWMARALALRLGEL